MSELGKYVMKKYNRDRYLTVGERLEHKREIQRKYREKNREKVRKWSRDRAKRLRIDQPDKVKEYKKRDYIKRKEQYKEKSRLWRLAHHEKYLLKQKEYSIKYKTIKQKPRCLGCEIILKGHEKTICQWCIATYSHKYNQHARTQ